MKTMISFALFLFMCNTLYAQNSETTKKPKIEEFEEDEVKQTDNDNINTNVFTLNLSKPSRTSLKSSEKNSKRLSFRSRDLIQFEVVGGNPFKYKYVINNKLIDFFDDKSEQPIKKIEDALKLQQTAGVQTAEASEVDKDSEIKELTQLKNKITTSGVKSVSSDLFIKENKISTASKNAAIADINTKIDSIKKSKYEPRAIYSMRYLRSIDQMVRDPKNVAEDKALVLNAIIEIRTSVNSSLVDISSYERAIKSTELLYIKSFKRDRAKYRKNFDSIVRQYLNVMKDVRKFDRISNEFEATSTELKEDWNKIIDIINSLYKVKVDNLTLPIDINGKNIDVVEISLERFEDNNPIATDTYKYSLWVKGGLKIDVSGGIFLTSLVNNEYVTESRTTTIEGEEVQRRVIRKKEKGNFEFGFGSAINISHRSASWVNPTLNFGALFTVNQQFQLLSGLGAILGKEERIIVTGGVSMGRVTRISEPYIDDGLQLYDLGESGVVPTANRFDFGYYFGLTYNFSKNKKQKGAENSN